MTENYVHLIDGGDEEASIEREAVAVQHYDIMVRHARKLAGASDDVDDVLVLEEVLSIARDHQRRREIAVSGPRSLAEEGEYEAVVLTPELERSARQAMRRRGLNRPTRVVSTPGTMLGQPRLEETRVTVESLLVRLRSETIEEIGRDPRLPTDWWPALQDWLACFYPHLGTMNDAMLAEMNGTSEHHAMRIRQYAAWVHETLGLPMEESDSVSTIRERAEAASSGQGGTVPRNR